MTITYIGSTEQSTSNDATPITLTVDIGTRTDGLLIVSVHTIDTVSHTHSSPTWNGVAMGVAGNYETQITTGVYSRISIYFLTNPANGSNTFSLTYGDGTTNEATNSYVVAAWYDGVNQTQASVLDQTNQGNGSTDPSVSAAPTENGELMVLFYTSEANNVLTANIGTIRQDIDFGPRVTGYVDYVQATAGTQAMSMAGADDAWMALIATFKPVGAALAPPTVALNTADDSTLGVNPTLLFTGTSDDDDDIVYQIQISTSPDFDDTETLSDNIDYLGSLTGGLHPNPNGTTTWEGYGDIDDRFCYTFVVDGNGGNGSLIPKIVIPIDMDETDVDGEAVVRIFNISGTPGTNATPANPADQEDTPTPGWLAESDPIAIVYPTGPTGWLEFDFTGSDLIWLPNGNYMWQCDWHPDLGSLIYTNAIELSADVTPTHGGNTYVDSDSANYGVRTDFDILFAIFEQAHQLDKVSDTDSGFSGSPDSSSPFASGQQVSFTVQSGDSLYDDAVYYWRVRGIDPAGSNEWGDWSTSRSFTVAASTTYDEDIDLTMILQTSVVDKVTVYDTAILNAVITVNQVDGVHVFNVTNLTVSLAEAQLETLGIAQSINLSILANMLEVENITANNSIQLDTYASYDASGGLLSVDQISLDISTSTSANLIYQPSPVLDLNISSGLSGINSVNIQDTITLAIISATQTLNNVVLFDAFELLTGHASDFGGGLQFNEDVALEIATAVENYVNNVVNELLGLQFNVSTSITPQIIANNNLQLTFVVTGGFVADGGDDVIPILVVYTAQTDIFLSAISDAVIALELNDDIEL